MPNRPDRRPRLEAPTHSGGSGVAPRFRPGRATRDRAHLEGSATSAVDVSAFVSHAEQGRCMAEQRLLPLLEPGDGKRERGDEMAPASSQGRSESEFAPVCRRVCPVVGRACSALVDVIRRHLHSVTAVSPGAMAPRPTGSGAYAAGHGVQVVVVTMEKNHCSPSGRSKRRQSGSSFRRHSRPRLRREAPLGS